MTKKKLDTCYNITYPVHGKMDKNYNTIVLLATDFYNSILEEVRGKDINLIFSGSSGCMVATIFYSVIKQIQDVKIDMFYIRKKGEESHETLIYSRDLDRINIFVDDHIFEGETLYRCYDELVKEKKDFVFDYIIVSWVRIKTIDRINICNNIVYSQTVP